MTKPERANLVRLLLRQMRDEAATFDSLRTRPLKRVPDHGREF